MRYLRRERLPRSSDPITDPITEPREMFRAYKFRLWTNANQERELGIMLESHLAPRRWLAARSSNISKFITTISVCTAPLVIRRLASLKSGYSERKNNFFEEKVAATPFQNA